MLIPAFVTARFGRGRVWPQVVRLILSVATLVIAVQVPLGATGSAKAATKSVDCADLARYVVTVVHGMAVQAAGGAGREDLLRVAEMALRAWPEGARKRRRKTRGNVRAVGR